MHWNLWLVFYFIDVKLCRYWNHWNITVKIAKDALDGGPEVPVSIGHFVIFAKIESSKYYQTLD